MPTMFGTSHFVSRKALIAYYKSQEYDMNSIQQKLDEGLCSVGRPVGVLGDIVLMNDEGRYLVLDDPEVKMRAIKLHFKDSRYDYVTSVNGTRRSVCQYFNSELSRTPIGSDGDGETVLMRPTRIVFMDPDGHTAINLK